LIFESTHYSQPCSIEDDAGTSWAVKEFPRYV